MRKKKEKREDGGDSSPHTHYKTRQVKPSQDKDKTKKKKRKRKERKKERERMGENPPPPSHTLQDKTTQQR